MSRQTPQCIAIVRHGETNWNRERRIQGRTEVPLNDTGRQQAIATGRQLADPALREHLGEWQGLYSSSLGRAIETAQIIGAQLAAAGIDFPTEPKINDELIERNFGVAEGRLVAELEGLWPGFNIPGVEDLEGAAASGGAETLEELAARSAAALEAALNETPGAILVSHGAMIRAGLARLTGADVPRVLNGEIWLLDRGPRSGSFRARNLPTV